MGRALLWILLGTLLAPCVSDTTWALPLEKKSCTSPLTLVTKPKTQSTIDKTWAPKQILNQAAFGTCYAFSTYYTLQFLVNSHYKSTKNVLSLPNIMGQGSEGELPIGGYPFALLHNLGPLSEREIALDPHWTHYKALFNDTTSESIHCPSKLDTLSAKQLYDLVASVCLPLVKAAREERRAAEAEVSEYADDFDVDDASDLGEHLKSCKDPKTLLHKSIFDFKNFETPKVNLPPFNVHAFNFQDVEADQRATKLYKMAANVIKKGFPVSISVSVGEKDGHAMTLTGTETDCCKAVSGALQDCEMMVEVVNSHDEPPGWFKAGPLAAKTLFLNYLNPCSKGGEEEVSDDAPEKCVTHVIGPSPKLFLVASKDPKALDSYLSGKPDPLAKPEKALFIDATTMSTSTPEFLTSVADVFHKHRIPLNEPNIYGRNALHLAVTLDKTQMIPAVIRAWNKYRIPLNHQDLKGNTPLHNAIGYGSVEGVTQLVTAWSENRLSFQDRNKEGKTAFDVGLQMIADHDKEIVKLFADGAKALERARHISEKERIQKAVNKLVEIRLQSEKPLLVLATEGDMAMLAWIKANKEDLWKEAKARTPFSEIADKQKELRNALLAVKGSVDERAEKRKVIQLELDNVTALQGLFRAR